MLLLKHEIPTLISFNGLLLYSYNILHVVQYTYYTICKHTIHIVIVQNRCVMTIMSNDITCSSHYTSIRHRVINNNIVYNLIIIMYTHFQYTITVTTSQYRLQSSNTE